METPTYWLVANWLRLIESARGESCPSGQRRGPAEPGEDKVPSPGQKSFHISSTTTWDENADPSSRYRSARYGNPNPTVWLLIGWSQRAARVASREIVEVPPHPGRIGSHPRTKNLPIYLQRQQTGDENADLPGRCAPQGVETPTQLAGADSLRLSEPARGESCPSGQRRGPAAPGEDKFPFLGQKSFHISTTRGRKRRSPGSIPPRRVWKPQPNRLVDDGVRLMEPARGESCPSRQRRGPAAPGEHRVSSPY